MCCKNWNLKSATCLQKAWTPLSLGAFISLFHTCTTSGVLNLTPSDFAKLDVFTQYSFWSSLYVLPAVEFLSSLPINASGTSVLKGWNFDIIIFLDRCFRVYKGKCGKMDTTQSIGFAFARIQTCILVAVFCIGEISMTTVFWFLARNCVSQGRYPCNRAPIKECGKII